MASTLVLEPRCPFYPHCFKEVFMRAICKTKSLSHKVNHVHRQRQPGSECIISALNVKVGEKGAVTTYGGQRSVNVLAFEIATNCWGKKGVTFSLFEKK